MKHAFVSGPPGTGNKLCTHVSHCGREGKPGDEHVEVDWRALASKVRGYIDNGYCDDAEKLEMLADIDSALLSAGKSGGE